MRIKITDFDYKGRGFSRVDNKATFLDGGVIGDEVEAQIIEEKKNFNIGKVNKIITPSEDRVKSQCPYFKECGGCDFLEYKYSSQIKWKKNSVVQDYKKAGLKDIKVEETIAMEEPFNYRNNIQLKVKDEKLGYFSKNSKKIVEIEKCLIAEEEINKAIKIIKNWSGLPSIKEVILRQNKLGELMIVLVSIKGAKKTNELLNQLLEINLKSLFENINTTKNRFSKKFKKLYGEDYIIDEIGGYKFKISPESFFQVNRKQAEKLYKKAIDSLEINSEDIILDLYCGIGTLSLLASSAKEVIGVEIVEKAVEDARENAELNKVHNTRFIAGKSEEIIEKLIEENIKPSKIIIDPPRAGIDKKLVEKIIELSPEKIAYISCNPTTQARDIKLLEERYKVEQSTPVDMFCNSVHCEDMALMTKIEPNK